MSTFLQTVDVFDKFRDDGFRVQTKTGSLISIAFLFFSVIVIGTEIYNFLQPKLYRDLNVDPSLTNNQELINISINVLVNLPCFFLHLDVLDSIGLDRYYVSDTVKFKRLSLIQESDSEELPPTLSSYKFLGIANKTAKDVCFSCYDVADYLPEKNEACCNSCEQLILLYRQFGKKPEPQNWEQCKAGKYSRDVTFDEKCQVKGKITVNKVPGTFHIAPGINNQFLMKYHHGNHQHKLNYDFPKQGLGMTHQIINIRFGSKNIPRSSNHLSNILNGRPNLQNNKFNRSSRNENRRKQAMIYKYDLTSTPAVYVKKTKNGNEVKAVGFDTSMINFQYPRSFPNQNPGIFFYYTFTPYTVVISNDAKESDIIQVISSTMGFLAGVFVVASIIDAILAQLDEKRKSRRNLDADEEAKEQ